MDEELLRLEELARDELDEEELEFDPSTPFVEIEARDSLGHARSPRRDSPTSRSAGRTTSP